MRTVLKIAEENRTVRETYINQFLSIALHLPDMSSRSRYIDGGGVRGRVSSWTWQAQRRDRGTERGS